MAERVQPSVDLDEKIQQNLLSWYSNDDPLAAIPSDQLDYLYELEDNLSSEFCKNTTDNVKENTEINNEEVSIPIINTKREFIAWMLKVEKDIEDDKLQKYYLYNKQLNQQKLNCAKLYENVNSAFKILEEIKNKYTEITSKTDSLHNLSDQLLLDESTLRQKRDAIKERLHYFLIFNATQESIEKYSKRINSREFANLLDTIEKAIKYLNDHIHFKEARVYQIKYESLLTSALNKVYYYVFSVITDATKQLMSIDTKDETQLSEDSEDTAKRNSSSLTLFYGKFHNVASKVKTILSYLESKQDTNSHFKDILIDCQKSYTAQRLRVLNVAVLKALSELREKHKQDHSIQFRSCTLFMLKTCQDEIQCYGYFFECRTSPELDNYLGSLCQNLYDVLRPSLILVNHVEILSELCGILRKEMLNDIVINDKNLIKYVEIVQQLLQDVEERLVFRTNIFFQHDLLGYKPSPGDLAYPEKLQHLEGITQELIEFRPDSRTSLVSLDQDVSQISSSQSTYHRSYTGNSPADLHGMWYPTVKRTLVLLSRLYTSLDRTIFQGLAQEALLVCAETIETATQAISTRKTEIDGRLFQIKHLLILREQIAPFQVDFTAKELSLDFSNIQKAALDLVLNKRDKIFVFGPNNALLEFLLEGTPSVKEYLVDSRKEIDKQLKFACETFISATVRTLTDQLQNWMKKAEIILHQLALRTSTEIVDTAQIPILLPQQELGKAECLAQIVSNTIRNFKNRIPEIQKSMQLYLANRETEFILFRPIKNQLVNTFIQLDQILDSGQYSVEERLIIASPTPEQINVLICSVSLSSERRVNTSENKADTAHSSNNNS